MRSSLEVYEKESEKGEIMVLKRQNKHLQVSMGDFKHQAKEYKQKNEQLMHIVKSQEELIGCLKQNLMLAVQSNPNEVHLIPYSIRIPKY